MLRSVRYRLGRCLLRPWLLDEIAFSRRRLETARRDDLGGMTIQYWNGRTTAVARLLRSAPILETPDVR